jgi:hypothetical protein
VNAIITTTMMTRRKSYRAAALVAAAAMDRDACMVMILFLTWWTVEYLENCENYSFVVAESWWMVMVEVVFASKSSN